MELETKQQELVDELKTAWEGEFKPLREKIEQEIKDRGDLSAETKLLETKIDAAMDELEVRFQKLNLDAKRDDASELTEKKAALFQWMRKGHLTPEQIESKVLVVSDDTSVGALVPVEYDTEITKGVVEFSPVRSIARVSTIGRQSLRIPKRTGTFAARWVGETQARTETTGLGYSTDEIPAHELYALVDISNQALEDEDYNLEAELNAEFAEQFGVAEGLAFVSGDAVGKPEGYLTNGSVTVRQTATNDVFVANDVIDLYYAPKTAYAARGTWAMNRGIIKAIRKFQDNQGNYLWQPGLAGLAPATILDRPYVEMPDMANAVVDQAKIITFGDFTRAYRIIDRIGTTIQRDPFTQNTAGATRFIARRRVGGQVVNTEAIQTLKVQ